MKTLQELAHIAAQDVRWAEAAEGIMNNGWDLHAIAADEATTIVSSVVRGHTTIKELRRSVRRANALDAEAVELHGSDLNEGEERFERTARRVMHHAGRTALRKVGTRQKQTACFVQDVAYRTSIRGDLYDMR